MAKTVRFVRYAVKWAAWPADRHPPPHEHHRDHRQREAHRRRVEPPAEDRHARERRDEGLQQLDLRTPCPGGRRRQRRLHLRRIGEPGLERDGAQALS
jgi:hypothetical protein